MQSIRVLAQAGSGPHTTKARRRPLTTAAKHCSGVFIIHTVIQRPPIISPSRHRRLSRSFLRRRSLTGRLQRLSPDPSHPSRRPAAARRGEMCNKTSLR